MLKNKAQLLPYFKLLGKSYWRLFNEFPLVLRLLFVLLLGVGGALLVNLPFSPSVQNYAIVFVVFFLLAQRFCRMSASEKVLLSFLTIPIVWIRFIKSLFVSIPFFLLDLGSGLLVITLGTLAVTFYSGGTIRNIRITSFYSLSSYQWLGMYRRTGLWVVSIGSILLLIGLWHGNTNLVCFCLGWIICLPCFLAYYGQLDPKQFMRVYKDSRVLLRRKTGELLMNVSIPVLACLACLLFFDFAHIGLYLKFILLFLYADLLMFYFCYLCYPHFLSACILFAITAYISAGLFFSYPLITILSAFVFLIFLHLLTVINLKSIIAWKN